MRDLLNVIKRIQRKKQGQQDQTKNGRISTLLRYTDSVHLHFHKKADKEFASRFSATAPVLTLYGL